MVGTAITFVNENEVEKFKKLKKIQKNMGNKIEKYEIKNKNEIEKFRYRVEDFFENKDLFNITKTHIRKNIEREKLNNQFLLKSINLEKVSHNDNIFAKQTIPEYLKIDEEDTKKHPILEKAGLLNKNEKNIKKNPLITFNIDEKNIYEKIIIENINKNNSTFENITNNEKLTENQLLDKNDKNVENYRKEEKRIDIIKKKNKRKFENNNFIKNKKKSLF
jgi:hypothetical protein